MNEDYRIETCRELSPSQIIEIRELESLCNYYDLTQYKLFLENTLNADRDVDFMHLYRYKGKLISFVLLFFPDIEEIEVYGFTHPKFRKKGLFNSLLASAGKRFKKNKNSSFLYVCDPRSADGVAYLQKQGRILEETEYMMELNRSVFDAYLKLQANCPYHVELRTGGLDQLQEISNLAANMYGEEKTKSVDFVRQTILSERREQLAGYVEGSIFGICTLGREDDFMMINGLAVEQSQQGQGLGRLLLNLVISYAEKKFDCPLKLEVSSVNDRAYKLYKSVGFEQKESYGYYR